MYNKTLSACLLLIAILLGCAYADVEQVLILLCVQITISLTLHFIKAQAGVSLHMFGSSSTWWVAVKPGGDDGKTGKIEMKDSGANSNFQALTHNKDWGYWTISSPGRAFVPPLTFRLTSTSGAAITAQISILCYYFVSLSFFSPPFFPPLMKRRWPALHQVR